MKKRKIIAYQWHMDGKLTSYGEGVLEGEFTPDTEGFNTMEIELFRLKNGKRAWAFEVMVATKGKQSEEILKKAKVIEYKEWSGTTIFPVAQPITGISVRQ